jgi:hypothetical protein
VDVARLVSFADEKEKAIAADAKDFWHAREFYPRDTGSDKDFGGRPPLRPLRRDKQTAATNCG